MAAAVDVESDGSVRDLFQDPPFDLQNVRFDVSGLVSQNDLDVETLETLYSQMLQEIYDRTGVTALYPPGHFPACHDATVKLLMKNHGLMWTESFTKSTGYRTLQRRAKLVTEQDQELPEDIKNLIPCPYAPFLLSCIALVLFRKPPTGSPSKAIISMFCDKNVAKWLNLAIRIYERDRSHLLFISVDDGYNLDDGRQSRIIQDGHKKYLRVKSHSVDDSVFQHEIDQYFKPEWTGFNDHDNSEWTGFSDHDNSEWTGFSDHDNPSDDEMDLDSQHVTSDESVQPDSDDKLQKLYTMLHRHEPAFLKFSQEAPQILLNSASTARDVMRLTILVNMTNKSMAAEAKRQREHDKNMMSILQNVQLAFQDTKTRIGTLEQRLTESIAGISPQVNASVQELLNKSVAEISTQVNASVQELLNKSVAEISTQVNASMQQRLTESTAGISTQVNASVQELLNKSVAEISTQVNASMQQRLTESTAGISTQVNASVQELLNKSVTEISTQVNASMEEGPERYKQALISVFRDTNRELLDYLSRQSLG
ncbi:hypothetical protein J7337_005826 [Fusarium musae]|uniref:Uncharacterized protein n=1 Tax=Fusarium musae TaxID=1042133 RepID=A0A9P8DJG1_9HYPO|nr:hypothetical protein J7337_005826 [Fusarium musae]KAG9502991.1 hypothetical protein J7337_005826 [Fusarium musae]